MLHLMYTMDKDWFGVFLTSKWTSVFNKQHLHVVQVSIFCMKKKYLVIGLIENENKFFMKRKFMDSAEVTLTFGGL